MSDTPDHPEHHAEGAPPPEPTEVVHPGGSGRPVRAGRIVRIGLAVLALFGAVAVFFAGLTAANPAAGVCGAAVAELEDADEPPLDPDSVDCDEEADRAAAIEAAEEVNGDDSLPSEATYRTSGIIGAAVGLVQLAGALLTLRTGARRWRTVALVGAGLGIVVLAGLLFPIGIIALAFSVWAIFFSRDARLVFGEPTGPRLFRPRG